MYSIQKNGPQCGPIPATDEKGIYVLDWLQDVCARVQAKHPSPEDTVDMLNQHVATSNPQLETLMFMAIGSVRSGAIGSVQFATSVILSPFLPLVMAPSHDITQAIFCHLRFHRFLAITLDC